MNNQLLPPATLQLNQQVFCVSQKIKDTNSHWEPSFPASQHDAGNYKLVTAWADSIEYALYKRVGGVFILIDFFSDIDAACTEAKELLCKIPKFEKSISAMAEYVN
ncbi:hypothetical protein [Serratia fonticola]|uniref:hypothetical protein n=1 Tax=Serratia fonticola TaxID=47917 RepID=UPI0027FD7694|nr:hypothetical protein [Serratia fonticola]MDQ7208487.1 hypothetical protein [Serratia fonticola]HBE9078600.1 hypothetical protein [Serratia fonticola]HBE9151692.1 hypothetical protein [Serratia fonticola]